MTLDEAVQRGDHREARRLARELVASAEASEDDKQRAKAILVNTGIDKPAIVLAVLCAAFLIVAAAGYAGR